MERVQPRGAVGEEEHRVVGAGVAVHRDGVEGAVGDAAQERRERGGVSPGVGREHGEQGREVGVNHPRTFGDAADREGARRRIHPDGAMLGPGIGRHDRPRGLGPACRGESPAGLAEARRHLGERQRHADDAGRKHQGGARRQPRRLLGGLGHRACGGESLGAGAGVGDAGVHGDGPDAAGTLAQQVLVVDDGGGADGVAREHAGGGAAGRADEQRNVGRAVLFQPGGGSGGGEALRRGDRPIGERDQGGGHGRFKIRRENYCVTVPRSLS